MSPGELVVLGLQILVVLRKCGDFCLVKLGLALVSSSGKEAPAQAVIFVLFEDPVIFVELAQDDLGVILNLFISWILQSGNLISE